MRILLLLFCSTLLFSCKKPKEPVTQPVSESIIGTHVFAGSINHAILTSDGNIVISGINFLLLQNMLVKHSSTGKMIWKMPLNNSILNNAIAMQDMPDGGLLVAGINMEGNTNQLAVARIDAWGNQVWIKTYGSENDETTYRMLATPDNNYLICAASTPANSSARLLYLLKINAEGDSLWSRLYDTVNIAGVADCINTSGNTVTISCPGNMIVRNMKIDNSGNILWSRKDYVVAGSKQTGTIYESPSGDMFTCGTNVFDMGGSEAFLMKVNSSGALIWEKTYPVPGMQIGFNGMVPDGNGGAMLTGISRNTDNESDVRTLVMSVDGDGNRQWHQHYDNYKEDQGLRIFRLPGGEYIVAGNGTGSLLQEMEYFIMGIKPDGSM